MKVKRRKYTPPEADLIRPAITGNIVALFDVRAHYDRLMRYKLNKEIMAFPALVRCMPVAANSPRILIRWVEKELLNSPIRQSNIFAGDKYNIR